MKTSTNESTRATLEASDWESVVSEASQHVQERGAAQQAAAERQKPKSDRLRIVALSAMLVAVVGWDVYAWTRAPEPPPPSNERVHMAWLIADIADAVEDFHLDEGRWPTEADLADDLVDGVSYRTVGDRYEISMTSESATLAYDGSVPLADWILAQADAASAGEPGS